MWLIGKCMRSAAIALLLPVAGGSVALAQKSGGTLRMYNSTNPPSASIHEETTIATVMSFSAVFNTLVRFDPMQERNSDDNTQSELATSWSWDATRTKLTVKLRDDVKWHDGKPFTAKDVQCTFHRLDGKEKEYLRRNPRSIWYDNLTEVTVDDDYRATFHLGRPQVSLLSMLASGYTVIYPCHVAARDMRTKPIGTGPFKFGEFRSNEVIRHVRNPDYWRKGHPYLDAVEWRIVPNRSTRVLGFSAGEFDMTQIADITVALKRDVEIAAPKAICELKQTNVTSQLLVNRNRPPFDNEDIRMAMMLAIDRQAFIDILAPGAGAIGAGMMTPPSGNWGLPLEELAKLPGYGDPATQREEAKKLMEKHGYGPQKRLKVKVSTRDFNSFRDPAVILVDQLNRIHFEAELEVVASSVWYNRLFKTDYSVGLNLQGAGIDDPDAVIKMYFDCQSDMN